MAERPIENIEFAVQDISEIINLNGVPTQLSNKVEIPAQIIQDGYKYRQGLAYNYYNYRENLVGRMLRHLDERFNIGDLHWVDESIAGSQNSLEVSERLGGTWSSIGSQTINSTSYRIYRKTA